MEFYNLMPWGVIKDDAPPSNTNHTTNQANQEVKDADKKNEIDVITPAFGLLNIVEDLTEEKEDEVEDEKNLDTSEKLLRMVIDDDEDKPLDWTAEPENPFREPTPQPSLTNIRPINGITTKQHVRTNKGSIPLLDYLCEIKKCSLKELHVLFHNLEVRRELIENLQQNVQIRTSHLKPSYKNFNVYCHDLTAQSASNVLAMGGYLGITVRGYYYVKHKLKLCHPYLPCLIQFGGGHHRSFYPLECLSVIRNKMKGGCS
uniref:PAZ domain-containing protein n=1 Tax=Meloidogyne enterolobii TaxID=390850 RepID=A0A6V7Y872_MELEN|nr:unnamed protein product [Meloidogyne enterolobii]